MPPLNQPSPRRSYPRLVCICICICLCLLPLAIGCDSDDDDKKSSSAPSPNKTTDATPTEPSAPTKKIEPAAPSPIDETLHEGKTFAQWVDLLGDRADGPVASEVLMRAGEPAIPALLAALQSESKDRRIRVMAILRDGQARNDPRVVGTFIAALDDKDSTIRVLAIGALRDAHVKQPRAIESLAVLLQINREPWSEQLLVLGCLKDLGPDATAAAGAIARMLLDDSRVFARRKSLDTLIAVGGTRPETLEALVKAMSDEDDKVRDGSWERLKALGSKASGISPALVQQLADRDEILSQMAGAVLVKMGAGAVPAVVKALDSPQSRTRRLAVKVLALIGPPAKDALGPLEKLRNDEDPLTKKWAAEAIRVIEGEL